MKRKPSKNEKKQSPVAAKGSKESRYFGLLKAHPLKGIALASEGLTGIDPSGGSMPEMDPFLNNAFYRFT
jgi:hypothetical protein